MLKEKIRKRKWRANFRKNPVKHKKYKEHEKLKKWSVNKTKQTNTQMASSQPNGKNSSATNNSTANSSLSFSCKETLYRSIARANLQLPKSPNEKAEVIQRLATKYKLKLVIWVFACFVYS